MMGYPCVMIAGVQSGVGKTTVTMGLMAALRNRGMRVQPFKVGPDYIDPGLHGYVTGNASHNLDSWMGSEQIVSEIFTRHARNADISVVEGVMGLFDGVKNVGITGSSAHIAQLLNIPVVLVVNVKGMGQSCLAIIKGFMEYQPGIDICGIILNHAGSEYYRTFLKEEIERKLQIPVFGCLSKDGELKMPERHLGLLPREENAQLASVVEHMRQRIEQDIDLQRLVDVVHQRCAGKLPLLLEESAVGSAGIVENIATQTHTVCIGVAKDAAFSFYYQDNFDYLQEHSVEIQFFSPLHDECLPEVDGLYFGGGFPEQHLPSLMANENMMQVIRQAADAGMPIYAECGGMMYLAERIYDVAGNEWHGVGVVPYHIEMTKSLVGLGYVQATSLADSIIAGQGKVLRGHEFHYSQVRNSLHDAAFSLKGGKGTDGRQAGYGKQNILASYIHFHFRSNPTIVERLKAYCLWYQQTGCDRQAERGKQDRQSMQVEQKIQVEGEKQYASLPQGHGYTTGTCAAAATRAALEMLLHQRYVKQVGVQLPAGMEIAVPVEFIRREHNGVRAAVLKDAGNDPDITHNMEIHAYVELIEEVEATEVTEGAEAVIIIGGDGVGTVTKPGLSVPVGEAAINPVPRDMIRQQAAEMLPEGIGARVTISVPGGEEAAAKTLNPKLGIVGGISIIGTSGIVRPMSDEAYLNSLIPQIDQAVSLGERILVLTPGGMGERMAEKRGVRRQAIVQMSNFVGALAADCGKRAEVDGIVLYGHIGKLIKVAAGIFHTHSRMADARRETLAAYAALAGAPKEVIEQIMQLNTIDAGIEIMEQHHLQTVYRQLAEAVSHKVSEYIQVEAARAQPVVKGAVAGQFAGRPDGRSDEGSVEHADVSKRPIVVGTVLYALNGDILGYDDSARKLLDTFAWRGEDVY